MIIPQDLHEDLAWIGRRKGWLTRQRDPDSTREKPMTSYILKRGSLVGAPPSVQRIISTTKSTTNPVYLAFLDAASRFIVDGPKVFVPTDEQYESMTQVELRIPIQDVRSPYDVMSVRIPSGCRKMLAARFPGSTIPDETLVHVCNEDGATTVFCMSKFGRSEEFHVMTDHADGATVEDMINRRSSISAPLAEGEELDHEVATVVARAAINLCIFLTQHQFTVAPLDQVQWDRHRSKKHLRKFALGDYQRISLTQHVVIRGGTRGPGEEGSGGWEVKPHWRRGHWKAWPGHAARRAAGEQVPLYFSRPCLVRRDVAPDEPISTTVEVLS